MDHRYEDLPLLGQIDLAELDLAEPTSGMQEKGAPSVLDWEEPDFDWSKFENVKIERHESKTKLRPKVTNTVISVTARIKAAGKQVLGALANTSNKS